ncbi:sarcosine oxidase subunit delta [Pseudooceanicola antarcticus]|uniref:Sarcosine oxidase subunit delta n=1 Tax=Pseudooceanicola antarcticus TaxID=1247613 RepID=A0A285JBN9_9RHOB|nr:sarcosine oxidase subunit delta [Pseudooceanicola antarcticus]PJE30894.1 sarcosine oxidase subunit delta [Pseudooceanicola antarcticus]SNY57690.1 sarcosine oxidase subunit delta [Pseudooceanicola antarcticus]
MRMTCPLCGARDLREFTFRGAALARPEGDDWNEAWHDYLHLRDNPAGESREYWAHAAGCGAVLLVTRDTRTHEIFAVEQARGAGA